jgi:hypothetical protein
MSAAGASGHTPAPRDVRVKLDSLPMPLLMAVRDESDTGIAIEAELPWLSVGTALNLQLPNSVQRIGRIQSFDIGVTPPGSACLRIVADLAPADPADAADRAGEQTISAAPAPARPSRSWWPLAFLVGASLGGYAGLHVPLLVSLLRSVPIGALMAGWK